jgi:hypothetical protein
MSGEITQSRERRFRCNADVSPLAQMLGLDERRAWLTFGAEPS